MVRKILDALRATFISPEIVVLGLLLVLWLYSPSTLDVFGTRVKANETLWQWVLIAPVGILAWALIQARNVLFPVSVAEAKRSLHLWPDYWRLKLRVALCLLWIIVSAAFSIAVWTFDEEISTAVTGAVTLASVCVSVVAAGNLYWASIGVRERISK